MVEYVQNLFNNHKTLPVVGKIFGKQNVRDDIVVGAVGTQDRYGAAHERAPESPPLTTDGT